MRGEGTKGSTLIPSPFPLPIRHTRLSRSTRDETRRWHETVHCQLVLEVIVDQLAVYTDAVIAISWSHCYKAIKWLRSSYGLDFQRRRNVEKAMKLVKWCRKLAVQVYGRIYFCISSEILTALRPSCSCTL